MKKSQIIKIIVCFLPLLLLFLPAPAGMNPKAWELFPFYAGAILGIMLHPFSEAAILLIFLGFYSVTMKGQAVALSGYALAMTWLVVGAFVIAQAFRDTQLGKRIAYHLIRIFGRSAIGLGYAAAFSDFIIAPMTPSNAAQKMVGHGSLHDTRELRDLRAHRCAVLEDPRALLLTLSLEPHLNLT